MDGIGEVIATYGLPTALLLAVMWFLYKEVWVWWRGQWERVITDLANAIDALREETRASAELLRRLAERVEHLERRIGGEKG
ncbi:MAG: hypothetical protein RML84_11080 [Anaerolineae bacterium]|nr:hypothetical protein [Thermoflexales bacterium]MDW8293624.1 hypothetical protein [Anaerolineae bacterium]